MTQLCMDCKTFLREICVKCGRPATHISGDTYQCTNNQCVVQAFEKGAGGVSHGVCDRHYKIRHEQLKLGLNA